MKALILGCAGQLGQALVKAAPEGTQLICYSRETLDITDGAAVKAAFEVGRPDVVLNAAAYTAVDRAEADEATAFNVNATAVGLLADAARRASAKFVHVSTDFVFDGKLGTPYAPNAAPNPLSAYGRSKLAGEQLAGNDALIVRTAWVYGLTGANFVRTMLRLMTERPEVRVVSDQIGTPTYAPGLALALWKLAMHESPGIYHYTDSGVASWYDFAVAIQEEAVSSGLISNTVPVFPITTADFPTPARRPPYAVLDKASTFKALGGPAPHWRENLRRMVAAINACV